MEKKINVELSVGEASAVVCALAVYSLWKKDYQWEMRAKDVVKRILDLAIAMWPSANFPVNAWDRVQYPIKRVNVLFYDENPKRKPEGY